MNNQLTEKLKEHIPFIQKAIKLAKEREKEYSQDDELINGEDLDFENLAFTGKEKEVYDYLSSLDYETIKVMQTIMYIGRDGSFAEEDGTYDYYESRKAMDKQGWHSDKTIEANQIAEKSPLAEYLINGCKKIELSI